MCGRGGKAVRNHVAQVSKNDIGRAQIHYHLFMGIHASEILSSIVCVMAAIVETIPQQLVRNALIQYVSKGITLYDPSDILPLTHSNFT